MISEGYINHKQWNEEIIPLVDSGIYKDMSHLLNPGFLYIHQIFECLIADEFNTLWLCKGDTYDRVEFVKYKLRWN